MNLTNTYLLIPILVLSMHFASGQGDYIIIDDKLSYVNVLEFDRQNYTCSSLSFVLNDEKIVKQTSEIKQLGYRGKTYSLFKKNGSQNLLLQLLQSGSVSLYMSRCDGVSKFYYSAGKNLEEINFVGGQMSKKSYNDILSQCNCEIPDYAPKKVKESKLSLENFFLHLKTRREAVRRIVVGPIIGLSFRTFSTENDVNNYELRNTNYTNSYSPVYGISTRFDYRYVGLTLESFFDHNRFYSYFEEENSITDVSLVLNSFNVNLLLNFHFKFRQSTFSISPGNGLSKILDDVNTFYFRSIIDEEGIIQSKNQEQLFEGWNGFRILTFNWEKKYLEKYLFNVDFRYNTLQTKLVGNDLYRNTSGIMLILSCKYLFEL